MKRPGGILPEGSDDSRSEPEVSIPRTGSDSPKPFSGLLSGLTRKSSAATMPEGGAVVDGSARSEGDFDPDDQPTVSLDDAVIHDNFTRPPAEVIVLPGVVTDSDEPTADSDSDSDSEPSQQKSKFAGFARLNSKSRAVFARRSSTQHLPASDITSTEAGHPGSVDLAPVQSHDDPVSVAERELKLAERTRKKAERRELRRFTSHTRSQKRHWLMSIGSVLLLAAFVLIGVCSPLMAVSDVEVVGAQQVDVEELEVALERFSGVPLALIGEEELHRALEPFPLIQRYSVERIPPGTLRVNIEERQPVIAIAGENGYRMVDAAGVLTGEVTEIGPGIVRASGGVVDTASAAFSAAATVVRDLPEDIRVQIAEVSASNEQDIEFLLHSGVVAVWGEASDTQRKAVVLRAMLAAVGVATRIDVSAPEAPVFQ